MAETQPEVQEISTELVVPGTGELVDLTDEVQVGRALAGLRQFRDQLKQADALLTDALVERSQVLGTKTIHLPDGVVAEISGGFEKVYDQQAIEQDLRNAGMPDERIREIVVEVISYKVNALKAKAAAGANPEYRAIIERHTTEHEEAVRQREAPLMPMPPAKGTETSGAYSQDSSSLDSLLLMQMQLAARNDAQPNAGSTTPVPSASPAGRAAAVSTSPGRSTPATGTTARSRPTGTPGRLRPRVLQLPLDGSPLARLGADRDGAPGLESTRLAALAEHKPEVRAALMASCALCGEEILDVRRGQVAMQVTGWDIPRHAGGTNALHDRRETRGRRPLHLRASEARCPARRPVQPTGDLMNGGGAVKKSIALMITMLLLAAVALASVPAASAAFKPPRKGKSLVVRPNPHVSDYRKGMHPHVSDYRTTR